MSTILLFAKEPVPGRVKTRLTPPLTPRGAAGLAAAFLQDLVDSLGRVPGATLEIALPPGDSPDGVRRLLDRDISFVDQGTGDLGCRLESTMEQAFQRREGPVAVVGSDHPTLPSDLVVRILEEARCGRVGWVPTEDGGYAALAVPRPLPGLFRDVPWSTPAVAETTRRNARALGYALTDFGPWYDVDTALDLERLRADLAEGDVCPNTRAAVERLGPPPELR